DLRQRFEIMLNLQRVTLAPRKILPLQNGLLGFHQSQAVAFVAGGEMRGTYLRVQTQTFRNGGRQDGKSDFRPRPLDGLQLAHDLWRKGIVVRHWIKYISDWHRLFSCPPPNPAP